MAEEIERMTVQYQQILNTVTSISSTATERLNALEQRMALHQQYMETKQAARDLVEQDLDKKIALDAAIQKYRQVNNAFKSATCQ